MRNSRNLDIGMSSDSRGLPPGLAACDAVLHCPATHVVVTGAPRWTRPGEPRGARRSACVGGLALLLGLTASGADKPAQESDRSRFSDQPAPLRLEGFPERPRPLFEWGDKFLETGNIRDAIRLPTDAVWHPSFLLYGNYRTALQSFESGTARSTEWANRLDLFGNLQLAATERILLGVRPLDRRGLFTGYNFEPQTRRGFQEAFSENSLQLRTLFFEGEFGELFPRLDKGDRHALDVGISVGRQPFRLQDGLLVEDDSMDLFALTWNSILPRGGSSMRVSTVFGWNEVDRANNAPDRDAYLVGLNASADFHVSTFDADVLYVFSQNGGDGLYAGFGQTRRFGKINSVLRVVQSVGVERESVRVRTGTLLFSEMSYTPSYGHDLVYLNGFWGIDDFTSAVRAPTAGGPLGRTGIMFAAVGLGRYGAPLSNQAQRAAGGSLGYQMFFGELRRRQLILEVGGRNSTDGTSPSAVATGLRYQQAFGRRLVMVVDAFGGIRESSKEPFGGRLEFLVKF